MPRPVTRLSFRRNLRKALGKESEDDAVLTDNNMATGEFISSLSNSNLSHFIG